MYPRGPVAILYQSSRIHRQEGETTEMKLRISLLAAGLTALAVAGCGGASDTKDGSAASGGGGSKATLSLVAYSTPQVVYDDAIPAFQKTGPGEAVGFKQSYGASGDQSRAV